MSAERSSYPGPKSGGGVTLDGTGDQLRCRHGVGVDFSGDDLFLDL